MSVVVAYSPSDQGRAALHAGAIHASRRGVRLVVASHPVLGPDGSRVVAEEDAVLREVSSVASGAEPPVTVHPSSAEDVGEFVLRTAQDEGAELLVIGLRAKSRIGKLNLGAAARRIVLGSSCPVLAVKAG